MGRWTTRTGLASLERRDAEAQHKFPGDCPGRRHAGVAHYAQGHASDSRQMNRPRFASDRNL